MTAYSYEAVTREGSVVKGVIEADNERTVIDRLQQMDCYPVKVTGSEQKKTLADSLLLLTGSRVGERDVMTFSYQLGVLIEAGFPLDRSIAILADLTDKKGFQEILIDILSDVRSGKAFSDTLSKYPRLFSQLYINMIKAGESGGAIEDTLMRLSEYLENARRLKEDVRSALIYPSLLAFVGGSAVAVLLMFVVPRFSVIFKDMGHTLPLPTLLLLGFSSFLKHYWWIILSLLTAGVYCLRSYFKTDAGSRYLEELKFKTPVFGKLYRELAVARFARTLGTLIRSGVPILNALKISEGTLGSIKGAEAIAQAREGIRKGKSMAALLKNSDIFPQFSIHMIAVGEETGRLDEMLLKIAERFDIEVRATVKKLLSLLEPVLILLMGMVVAFIVISMLLAIFSLNDLPF
ncbi:MAG: type II secretion system F family protein [Dissulfurispiraceae bacterium]|nr:type II secretion system F family protein [Dissulfurispiraceae bacterium]